MTPSFLKSQQPCSCATQSAIVKSVTSGRSTKAQRVVLRRAEEQRGDQITQQDLMSDSERLVQRNADLRAAERSFAKIGDGTAICSQCQYKYDPTIGDPEFPLPKGVQWNDVPEDYVCPVCSSPRSAFEVVAKEVAGFEENQQYGLGTNSLTSEQKSLLIYGGLAVGFLFFMSGYFLD